MNIITSKSNNGIKNAKKLHQKKYRTDSYLIEGWHLFEEAVNYQAPIRQIFVLEAFLDRVEGMDQVTVVTPEILELLADSKTPQGIVAEIALEPAQVPQQLQGRYLYLEDVQDPGNVGTMIRTADAAGFDGVILSKASADIYSLKVLRSMQGSHFHLPIWKMDRSLRRPYRNRQSITVSFLRWSSLSWSWAMKDRASVRKWRLKQTSSYISRCQVWPRV